MPKIIKEGIVFGGGNVVDTTLDTTSTNPVENRAVATAIEQISDNLTDNDKLFKFGYDSVNDQYGYYKEEAGADTFVPFSGHVNESLLWENPSPSSSYGENTINLSDSVQNYDYLRFEFTRGTTNPEIFSAIYTVDELDNTAQNANGEKLSSPTIYIAGTGNYTRILSKVSDTSILFSHCKKYGTGIDTANSDTTLMPRRVYGLKLRTTPKTPPQLSFILKADSDGSSNGYSYITLPSEGYNELIAQSSLSRRLQVYGILSGVETKLLEVTSTAMQTVNITGYDHIMISTLSNGTSECNVSVIMN